MSRFILDCSVAVAWCIEDEALPLATRDQVLATDAKRCGVPLK